MHTNKSKKANEPLFHKPKIISVTKNWVWPIRVLLLLIAVYFINESYFGYVNEMIYGLESEDYYYLNENPFMFWLVTVGYLLIASGSIWQSFRVKVKT